MARSKKSRKTSSKIEKSSTNQTDPNRGFWNYEIVYENSDDLYGTIKFRDEETLEVYEKIGNYYTKHATDEDFDLPLDKYLDLIKKFEAAKDKKKIRFNVSELNVLENALNKHISHLASIPKIEQIKAKVAWANRVMKNSSISYEVKLRDAGRILGFTKGAKSSKLDMLFSIPPKGKKRKFEPLIVTDLYSQLVKSGIEKKEAVERLTAKFTFASPDACSRYLRKHGVGEVPSFDRD